MKTAPSSSTAKKSQVFTKGGTHATGVEFNSGFGPPEFACPPWYRLGGDGRCHSGNTLDGVVEFQEVTGQTRLQGLYCMTTHGNSANRTDEVGGCLFSLIYHSAKPTYPTALYLNMDMCGRWNREGQLCGCCIKGFSPACLFPTLLPVSTALTTTSTGSNTSVWPLVL